MPASRKDRHEDPRLSHLEGTVSGVQTNVASLQTEVRHLNSGVSALNESVNRLTTTIGRPNRTPWGVLGTWAAVMLSFAGAIGTLAIWPMQSEAARLNAVVQKMADDLKSHEILYWQERARRLEGKWKSWE